MRDEKKHGILQDYPRTQDERQRLYRSLFETAKDGMLLADPETGRITNVNPAMLVLSGCSREELVGAKLWEIFPLRDIDAGRIAVKELQTKDSIVYDDVPFRTKAGKPRSVEFSCTVHPLEHEKVIQCTLRDISGRKQIEEDLRKAEARFHALFREAAIGIVIVDDEDRIVENNRKLEDLLGYGVSELEGRPLLDLICPDDGEAEERCRRELLDGKRSSCQIETRCMRKDGLPVWTLINASLVRDTNGEPRFVIRTIEDISERKRTEEQLRLAYDLVKKQASTDALTGIFNRLKFNDFINQQVREAERYGHSLSLLMFDIDHFKKVNDTFGHQTGDCVLKELGMIVTGNIREADIFARWGGEEFVILAPQSGIESARVLAEKLCTVIEAHAFPCAGKKMTCSFGVTEFVRGDTPDSLIRRTDEALYKAKASGRNRVEVA